MAHTIDSILLKIEEAVDHAAATGNKQSTEVLNDLMEEFGMELVKIDDKNQDPEALRSAVKNLVMDVNESVEELKKTDKGGAAVLSNFADAVKKAFEQAVDSTLTPPSSPVGKNPHGTFHSRSGSTDTGTAAVKDTHHERPKSR